MNRPNNHTENLYEELEFDKIIVEFLNSILITDLPSDELQKRKSTLKKFISPLELAIRPLKMTTRYKKEQQEINSIMENILMNILGLKITLSKGIDEQSLLLILLNFIQQEVLSKYQKHIKKPNFREIINKLLFQQIMDIRQNWKPELSKFKKDNPETALVHVKMIKTIFSLCKVDFEKLRSSIKNNIDYSYLFPYLCQLEWIYYNLILEADNPQSLQNSISIINGYFQIIISKENPEEDKKQGNQLFINLINSITNNTGKSTKADNININENNIDQYIGNETDFFVKYFFTERPESANTEANPNTETEIKAQSESEYFVPIIAEIQKQKELICNRFTEIETESDNIEIEITEKKRCLKIAKDKYSQLLKQKIINSEEIWNINDTTTQLFQIIQEKKTEKEERKAKFLKDIQELNDLIDNENTTRLDQLTNEIKSLELKYNYCIDLQKLKFEIDKLPGEISMSTEAMKKIGIEYDKLNQVFSKLDDVENEISFLA